LAINKRKILESAQKHLQKGLIDKALADYRTLLRADPNDSNVLLKMGDLYLKQGKREDSINAYLRVAQQFTREGFDAKAVALYKQISRMDPKRHDVCVPLAELYSRMGLIGDALTALQTAADAAYRAGDRDEALELLRRMAALDPSNTPNRLKVAELLAQEGRANEALTEYEAVAEELERRGEAEERVRVLERIIAVDPERVTALGEVARAKLTMEEFTAAQRLAEQWVAAHPDDVDGYEVLGHALLGAGEKTRASGVFRDLAERFRLRGDEDRARDLMQRFGNLDALAPEGTGVPVEAGVLELDSEIGGPDDDFVLDEDPLTEVPTPAKAAPQPIGKIDPVKVRVASPEPEPARSEPETPSDPEQLLAEATVYRRYGKLQRAVEALRAILVQAPDHQEALEQLADALGEQGDESNAIVAWQRAAEAARAAADAEAIERCRVGLAGLDPAAAEALAGATDDGPIGASPDTSADAAEESPFDLAADEPLDAGAEDASGDGRASPVDVAVASDDFDIDFDIDADVPADGPAEEEAAAPVAALQEPSAEAMPRGPQLELPDEDPDEEETADVAAGEPVDAPVSAAGESSDAAIAAAMDDFPEVEFTDDFGDASAAEEPAVAPRPESAAELAGTGEPPEEDPTATTTAPVSEQLEEAEFYLEQGLLDEARDLYERILATAPSHPQAMLRLGEIAAKSGTAAPELAEEPTPAEAPPPPPASESDITLEVPGVTLSEPAPEPPQADVELAADTGDFDLAAELAFGFDGEEPVTDGLAGTEEEGFEQVFNAFKSGVDRELGEGDHEARYDLGIAYKEMGLLDDAIGEFRLAMQIESRRLSCLHMMGLCALDLGRSADAVAHLEQALSLPDLPEDQGVPLRYDLGRAYAARGDVARARAAFEAVRSADPEFGDVARELEALETRGVAEAASDEELGEEAYESFDDLLADHPEEPATPRYESFDDLFGEDGEGESAAGDEEPPVPTAATEVEELASELEAEPSRADTDESPGMEPPEEDAEEPSPDAAKASADSEKPGRPKRKRRKISFV